MYLLLLVFGAVLSLRDGSVDAGILTPGIVVTVGGVLLIGLGLDYGTLQRIEQVLATRPMPRPLPIPDIKPIELDDASRKTAELSLTAKPARNSQGSVAVHEKRAEEAEASAGNYACKSGGRRSRSSLGRQGRQRDKRGARRRPSQHTPGGAAARAPQGSGLRPPMAQGAAAPTRGRGQI